MSEASKGNGGDSPKRRGKPKKHSDSRQEQEEAANIPTPTPPPANGEEAGASKDQPTSQPKPKRQLTPAQLEARRKGGKARGQQLKNDPAHQSRAARASHESQGKEKLAERGRRNRLKALERYPDLYERAGEGALKGMAAKKERERLERERLAQQQHDEQAAQPDQAGSEPAPAEQNEKAAAENEGKQQQDE